MKTASELHVAWASYRRTGFICYAFAMVEGGREALPTTVATLQGLLSRHPGFFRVDLALNPNSTATFTLRKDT